MSKIYFATTNRGKVVSLHKGLQPYGIEVVHVPLELPEPRSEDLQKIATEKVKFAHRQIGKPCVALDSGFYVHSLNGFPKSYVNFALETIGIEGILKMTEGKPRECEFRNCLAYYDGWEVKYFESIVPGALTDEPRGEMRDYFWSGLFLIFVPEGYSRTLAEMAPEEYHAWRNERDKQSFTHSFGEWYSQQVTK